MTNANADAALTQWRRRSVEGAKGRTHLPVDVRELPWPDRRQHAGGESAGKLVHDEKRLRHERSGVVGYEDLRRGHADGCSHHRRAERSG
jgi:hypothetical protein